MLCAAFETSFPTGTKKYIASYQYYITVAHIETDSTKGLTKRMK